MALFISAFVLVAAVVVFARTEANAALTPFHYGTSTQAQQSHSQGFDWDWSDHHLFVRSNTFQDGGRIPQSMAFNTSGCTGQNKSPQLSWYGAPRETRTFTVQMFDVDASFTHWGMYKIPASTTSLPENAGVAGSTYGMQILNDFPFQQYDGPCPPSGPAHEYVITVFALDDTLNLPSPFFGAYPPFPETLLYGLLMGRRHILATGHITGYYSI
jgi:Raf kinase inhibitor-like YbhB/YbcL family protein